MKITSPHPIQNNVTTHSAQDAYQRVLSFSGASLTRDAVDVRVIDNVRNKTFAAQGSNGSTRGIIDSQEDVGGWPVLQSAAALPDSDGDGMPDAWELEMKLDPKKGNANGRSLSTGYDNIEVYINSLVKQIVEEQVK
jgi:hypothetical protein